MKLVGSRTEHEIREQLIRSNRGLYEGLEKRKLLEVLNTSFPQMKTAYTLYWIPEQGEDIYYILINDNIVAEVELDRYQDDVEPIVKSMSLPRYTKGLKKYDHIVLAVALDLARQKIQGQS